MQHTKGEDMRIAAAGITALAMLAMLACSSGNASGSNAAENDTTNARQYEAYQTASYKVTFIELGSESCLPCKQMKSVMKRVEETYPNVVRVIFHDVWTKEGEKEGEVFDIRLIPTQVFLDSDGNEFYRHEGFLPFEKIQKLLEDKI